MMNEKMIRESLENQDVLAALRFHAIGLNQDDRFPLIDLKTQYKEGDKDHVILLKQHSHLNTWGQGDVQISINKEDGGIWVKSREIDGDNWCSNWFTSLSDKMNNLLIIKDTVTPNLISDYMLAKHNNDGTPEAKSTISAHGRRLQEALIQVEKNYSLKVQEQFELEIARRNKQRESALNK